VSKVKVCERVYCDYSPCVEERIAQLDAEGFDTGKLRKWLEKVKLSDEQEAIWLAEHNEGLDTSAPSV
jgi:hypothetical protein